MHRLATCLLAIVMFTLPSAALTIEQIERNWGASQNERGTFTETYVDGTQVTGSFLVENAGRIQMRYPNGVVLTIANGRMLVDDPRSEPVHMSLGPLRQLFSTQPNLDGIIAGSGSDERVTTIALQDPLNRVEGTVFVTFDNATGKLLQWRNQTNGNNIVTRFRY